MLKPADASTLEDEVWVVSDVTTNQGAANRTASLSSGGPCGDQRYNGEMPTAPMSFVPVKHIKRGKSFIRAEKQVKIKNDWLSAC